MRTDDKYISEDIATNVANVANPILPLGSKRKDEKKPLGYLDKNALVQRTREKFKEILR
jgi:hypothetical protein